MKRFLDVLLSLLAIIFLSPLMLIISLIIICDDGLPVIFRQNRVGKGDELFKIKKFRTMKNGAPNLSTADFEQSDVMIFIGANPCIAHPILWERVMRNRLQPEIIVIDPRRTETAMQATTHLAIQPKGDLALLYGVANILIQRAWIDRDYIFWGSR